VKSLQVWLPGNGAGVTRVKSRNGRRGYGPDTLKIKNEKSVDNFRIRWYTNRRKDLLTRNPFLILEVLGMKLLKITADGLPLFKEKLDICFYAQQRVSEDQKDILYSLFSNIYLNPANGFIGINASGKTSVLKVILLLLGILNNEPINHIETKDILGNAQKAVLNIFFYSESKKEICRLETIITSRQTKTEGIVYRILSESLWSKQADEVITRKSLLDFDGKDPVMLRSGQEDFLSDDVSIMIAHNKKTGEKMRVVNLLQFTNINVLPFSDNIPAEVITYLDPTVESLRFDEKDQKTVIRLKFKGKEEIVMNNPIQLNNYLSSGTVKGMITFTLAQEVLKKGGYIVVDEVENHFNKEIVTTLMRFFMDSKLNKNGGTLIFSTHYPELLDEYDRNDSIYIIRNRNGITVENLSTILKRNDIKKSDAYQSGFLEGTTPMYDAYMRLKKSIAAALK
jgi:predicted ATP-dependent endonuclease of OLD family